MGLPGCKGCSESLEAEIESKKESGEELTEQEKTILDEGQDATPFAYGPLSGYDGAYCKFCFKIGLRLSVALSVLALVGLLKFTTYDLRTVGMGVAFALVAQLVVVGYLGRYPILGAVIGPIIERIFASRGVYLTAKAENEYAQYAQETASDGGVTVESGGDWDIKTDPTVDEHELPEDYFDAQEQRARERLNHFKVKIESLQEALSQERGEKIELKSELKETQQQIGNTKEEKKQTKQQLEEVSEEIEKKERQINHLSDFGKDRDEQNRLPIWVHDENGVKVGPKWYIKTVEVHLERDDFYGSAKFAYVVEKQGAEVPNHIPDTIDEDSINRYEDHLLPNPDRVLNPPEFEHCGEPGYPNIDLTQQPLDEYPRVLFHENKARVTDARKRIDETTDEDQIKHPALTLAYDTKGNYVAPPYDVRGFESAQEQRNLARKRYRQVQSLMGQLEKKDNFVEDLQHSITVLEDQLNLKDGFLNEAREQAQKATSAAMLTERQTEQARRGQEFLKQESQSHRELWETTNDQVRREREKRVQDNEDLEDTVREYDNIHSRKDIVDRVFQGVWGTGWNRPTDPFDYETIRTGDGDNTKEDVIRAFREEADEDKYRNLVKTIDGELAALIKTGDEP